MGKYLPMWSSNKYISKQVYLQQPSFPRRTSDWVPLALPPGWQAALPGGTKPSWIWRSPSADAQTYRQIQILHRWSVEGCSSTLAVARVSFSNPTICISNSARKNCVKLWKCIDYLFKLDFKVWVRPLMVQHSRYRTKQDTGVWGYHFV